MERSYSVRIRTAARTDTSDLECTRRTGSDRRPSDFNVVPENAARTVLLHAATPECDTVRCSLSIEAGQPRARGDYEILLSSNQYTDRTPTIVTEGGITVDMASQFLFRILEQRHHDTYLPALLSLLSRQKGEYRLRCRDLSFDGVAYDGVLTIQVGAPG